jgi:hypothetical protein
MAESPKSSASTSSATSAFRRNPYGTRGNSSSAPADVLPLPVAATGTRGEQRQPAGTAASHARHKTFTDRSPDPLQVMLDYPQLYASVGQRFWAKVDKSGGDDACWPWMGSTRSGYGKFKLESYLSVQAHRRIYTLQT